MVERYADRLAIGYRHTVLAVSIPVAGIVASEGFLFYDRVAYGMVGHAITLAVCVLVARVFARERNALGALALVPMFRLVNLGIPVVTEMTLVWLLLVYGSVLPGLYWYLLSNPDVHVGWVGRPVTFVLYLPVVVASSLALATVGFEFVQPGALIPTWQPPYTFVLGLVMIGFVALTEELLFRGLLQGAFVDGFGWLAGIGVASGIFGVTHAGYGSPEVVGIAVVVGLVLGVIYHLTESLVLVVICHGLMNVLLFGFFPLYGPVTEVMPVS